MDNFPMNFKRNGVKPNAHVERNLESSDAEWRPEKKMADVPRYYNNVETLLEPKLTGVTKHTRNVTTNNR